MMSQKLNIAILIAGEPRFGPEINQTINNLEGYETITWFFFLWDVPKTSNTQHPTLVAPYWQNVTYEKAYDKIVSNIGPKEINHIGAIKIESPREYGLTFPIKNRAHCCFNEHNVWSMWQGWYEGYKLIKNHGKNFDIVLRLRGDSAITNWVDLRSLKESIDKEPAKLFVPINEWFGFTRQINDWMAISSMNNIEIYSKVKESVITLQNEGIVFHPENTLAEHLFRNGIDYYDKKFHAQLRHRNSWNINHGSWA